VRNRRALDDAVRKAGGDPGTRIGVRERAIVAATDLIVTDGMAALTMEAVTRRIGCAATSVYAAFGDREGLLAAPACARTPTATRCARRRRSRSPRYTST
jgi:hypothetical protein